MKTLVTALLSIGPSVAAQFSLKAGMSGEEVKELLAQSHSLRTLFYVLTDRYVMGGLLLYGLGAVVWLAVLSMWDVSKAYPMVGLGFVLTVAIGFLLGEQVTAVRVLGVVLICAGAFIVGQS